MRTPGFWPAAIARSAWMQIAVMIGETTRKSTIVGTAASATETESSYGPVSISKPIPSTTRCTGITTAADRAMNTQA